MKKILALLALLMPFAMQAQEQAERSIDEIINEAVQPFSNFLGAVVFASFNLPIGGGDTVSVPFVLVWLITGAVFFTIYFRFINIRGFRTAIDIVRGKYTNPEDKGEVSHFQALTAALSGTVGLGNIAGVAIAVAMGGPGATFWMIIAGLIGMSTKFVECTLGVKYREIDEDGTVFGGPMYYLKKGFANLKLNFDGNEKSYVKMGKVLAVFFAIACIGGSFGGGNMFQANQAYAQFESITRSPVIDESGALRNDITGQTMLVDGVAYEVKNVADGTLAAQQLGSSAPETTFAAETLGEAEVSKFYGFGWAFGLVIMVLVAIVIIGGIRSIARVTDKIVPLMCGIYVLAALAVIFSQPEKIIPAFGTILEGAFSPEAVGGGFIGVLILGFRRAAFSNEAGIGSASIAHAAVKTNEPVSEGIVALLEPFIDTVVVCTMTALVIVITGDFIPEEIEGVKQLVIHIGDKTFTPSANGISLTSTAFEHAIGSWFPIVLGVAVILFAFSTMISWSYYGMQAWAFLFGRSKTHEYIYKAVFCLFVVLGSALTLGPVIDFSDCMIFLMCFPNIFGLIFLAPVVKRELGNFMEGIKSGRIKAYK